MALCDCNGRRIPTTWKVSISGITGTCPGDCSTLDGDYYPARVGASCTNFQASFSGVCDFTTVEATVTDNQNGTFDIQIIFFRIDVGDVTYFLASVSDLLAGPLTVPKQPLSGISCTWPGSLTLTAVATDLTMAQLLGATCLDPPKAEVIYPFAGIRDPGKNACPQFTVPTPRDPQSH